MKNPVAIALHTAQKELARRATILSEAAHEIEFHGLCGRDFGFVEGEEIWDWEESPESHRRINGIIIRMWKRTGRL